MAVKSLKQIKELKGKRVLLRVDFNVPLGKDLKVDKNEDYRLVQTIPTLKYLIKKQARIIIMTHLGRPNGKVMAGLRLDPVAKRLSQLLGKKVRKSNEILGKETKEKIKNLKNGEILLLENIRFDAREEKGDHRFARSLANLGDVFINEGFAVSHRDQVSVSTIQDYLPSYGGFLLEKEIRNLDKVFKKPKHPLVVIVGGAKISTKIKVIKRFVKVADNLLLGGALANTVLKVMGVSVGRSQVEPEMFNVIKKIKLTDNKLRVPLDGWLAKSLDAKKGRLDALADVKKDEYILDVGPDTIRLYGKIIKKARMIVWNGPMGMMETPAFNKGTKALVKILAKSRAETIVGGGETVTAIRLLGLENKFGFISTGGGAMLEYLEGKKLPGLKKIIKK